MRDTSESMRRRIAGRAAAEVPKGGIYSVMTAMKVIKRMIRRMADLKGGRRVVYVRSRAHGAGCQPRHHISYRASSPILIQPSEHPDLEAIPTDDPDLCCPYRTPCSFP
jgi:hypothetical protein